MEAVDKSKLSLMPMRSDERLAQRIGNNILSRYPVNSILDIGCGDGVVGHHIPSETSYLGLDITDASIYEQKHENQNIKYIHPDAITKIIEEKGPWDTILLLDVLEHTRKFTGLFEKAMMSANKHVIVSLPNELFFLDRLRMLRGKELNAHSLDLVNQPEGFKHQFIVNISKARTLLKERASKYNFQLYEEVLRPLKPKSIFLKPVTSLINLLGKDQLWSQGSIFIFNRIS